MNICFRNVMLYASIQNRFYPYVWGIIWMTSFFLVYVASMEPYLRKFIYMSMQNDVSSLLSQLKDMQHKNSELADDNKILLLKVSFFSISFSPCLLTHMLGWLWCSFCFSFRQKKQTMKCWKRILLNWYVQIVVYIVAFNNWW